jgi:hypothetical protein
MLPAEHYLGEPYIQRVDLLKTDVGAESDVFKVECLILWQIGFTLRQEDFNQQA